MIFLCDFGGFWAPWRELEGSQNDSIFELICWTNFEAILDFIWTPILLPTTTSEAGQGDNRRTFIFTDRVDENEPQALSAHPENASQKCFQKSSEKDTKMTSPGAPKMTQKWHQKWSWKSLQFWGAWELPRRGRMTLPRGPQMVSKIVWKTYEINNEKWTQNWSPEGGQKEPKN